MKKSAVGPSLRQPLSVPLYNEIGIFCYKYGEIAQAAECFSQALALQPQDSQLMSSLAKCYFDLLQADKAEARYRLNLQQTPADKANLNNLATLLRVRGEAEAGLALYSEQVRLCPDDLELKTACADYLLAMGSLPEGEALCRDVLVKNPMHPGSTFSLARILKADRVSEALQIMEAFIAKAPGNAQAQWLWASLLVSCGQVEASMQALSKSLRISPDNMLFHDDRAFFSLYLPTEQQDHLCQFHRDAADALQRNVFCRPFKPACDPDPLRPLTIAYMSPDLYRHSVSYFLEPLLRGHDREQVRVIVYSDATNRDAVNQRLRGLADQWYDVAGVGDNGLRAQIIRDGVDILIELAGHTGNNRLGVLAAVAAPVQVSYLGYPSPLELPAIPYRVTDEYADPMAEAGNERHQTLCRLPGGFLCYQADANAPEVAPLPWGRNDYVTFGSFNVREKLSISTLQMWARILDAVPNSRLLLKARCFADPLIRQAFIDQYETLGIAAERLQVMGHVKKVDSHLALYAEVDIALDPLSYNGTTTSCEGLWQGVPMVSLQGDRHASRVGSSLLHQLGLGELVAMDESDYLQIATRLASDTVRLEAMRTSMRERMRHSPLMDEQRIGREMDAAYRQM
ncbi:MAG: hypothetical protein V7629_09330 [Motiliproteus sp.]